MIKHDLIAQIKTAFANVKLEDGIGIWQAQGIDDYADSKTIIELKAKDERNNWDKIPNEDLVYCASSLSFFDDKGMRFCLPKFLIFDLEASEIYENNNNPSPDLIFTLSNIFDDDYQKTRFSLFNTQQTQAVIDFLKYKKEEFAKNYAQYSTQEHNIETHFEYIELNKTLNEWKQKLKR